MTSYVVVNQPQDWPLDTPGVEVVSARSYLTDAKFAQFRGVKIFNLCRSYRYQSLGYYVSLIAAARGHKPLPSVSTIQDLKSVTMIRFAGEELEELIDKSLSTIQSEKFVLSIYFGKNVAKKYDKLCQRLFRMFPAPLMRATFAHDEEGWFLQNVSPIANSDIPPDHKPFVIQFAREYFSRKTLHPTTSEVKSSRYNLAILYDEKEVNAPSDEKAIAKFVKAAEKLDFDVDIIDRDDYGRIAEFDALFIRETTNVTHHTFRFARRAQAEGLIVIDDPDSILRCANKVFLAELLTRNKIATPKTLIVHRDNIDDIPAEIGFPCILKQPDGSFSQGVTKADTLEELEDTIKKLLDKSELVIAQEFLPTPFDWRVGILDRQPLYACKYFMSKKHWQIVQKDKEGKPEYGRVESVPLWRAPHNVVQTALNAANLIGDGLYGVDMKEIGDRVVIVEINDNPNIDAGSEDGELKDALYQRIMEVFLKRVERRKERRNPK